MSEAAVFPGQGSQKVGMGFEVGDDDAVAEVFEVADTVLKRPLSTLIATGPKTELDATANAQPALFTVNYIYWLALGKKGFRPAYLAGHSLGEFSACAAGGVFSFEDGLKIVERRGALMSDASRRTPGGMAAVIGLEDGVVDRIAGEAGVEVANYNCPGQVVISGGLKALDRAEGGFKEAGAKRFVRLDVSGAFHSSAMSEAAAVFRDFIDGVDFADPRLPVVSNATGATVKGAGEIKEALAAQLTGPVRWRASVECLARAGVDRFVEVGPGKVLTGLIKRISAEAAVVPATDY